MLRFPVGPTCRPGQLHAGQRLVASPQAATCEKLKRFGQTDFTDSPPYINWLYYTKQTDFILYILSICPVTAACAYSNRFTRGR